MWLVAGTLYMLLGAAAVVDLVFSSDRQWATAGYEPFFIGLGVLWQSQWRSKRPFPRG